MKRNIYVVLIALIFLFAGLQPAFSQEAASPDRGSGVTVDALPGELKWLDIKDYHIVSEERPAGLIQTLLGHVVVRIGDTDRAYFAARGDQIFEKDAIFTLKGARCRVRFNTDDIVTMGQNSRIGVDEIIDDRKNKKKKSVISMLRGRAMFYVMRLFRYKTAQTLVKTPTAICGVRGTKFGVEVRKTDKKLAQTGPVYLADASGSGAEYLMAAAGTNGTTTIVYGFEGEVEVTSPVDGSTQTVGDGQNLELTGEGAGDV
ncbi:MAG: FecR family protein, partial [Thermodesulfobacteriota bacterium]|nr:FecR family protein [Thermodesulfobacteriota bacterium]